MVEAKVKKKGNQSRSEYKAKKKKYPSRANKPKSNQIKARYEAKAKARKARS